MAEPRILVLSGYGINCESETAHAFDKVGGRSEVVHVNDLIDGKRKLEDYQILAFPGGFSYGDDTGAGKAMASRIKNHLWDDVRDFVELDKLAIGICNGCQVMANLGLVPGLDKQYGDRSVAFVHNESARYVDRWVDLEFEGDSPWVQNLGKMSLPIAHGEGKFYAKPDVLKKVKEKGLVAARYVSGEICEDLELSPNPNGSLEGIAGLSDGSGRLMAMMPHPERAQDFTQHPLWTLQKELLTRQGKEVPEEGRGLELFRNGVEYFE